MLAGIREIEIVVKPEDRQAIQQLLGHGNRLGLSLKYRVQDSPRGIVDGLLLCASRHPGRSIVLALGDNIFHGSGLTKSLRGLADEREGAAMLLKQSNEPEKFGVARLRQDLSVETIVEKPTGLVSGLAVTGMYFFGADVVEKASSISPSTRGELEVTDLLNSYASEARLQYEVLPRGTVWKDAGSFEGLHEAQTYVRTLQSLTGQLIGSPEEIAWRNGWITSHQLQEIGNTIPSAYGQKLFQLPDL